MTMNSQLTEMLKKRLVAVSLPPEFRYGAGHVSDKVFERIILPVCAERGLAFLSCGSRILLLASSLVGAGHRRRMYRGNPAGVDRARR